MTEAEIMRQLRISHDELHEGALRIIVETKARLAAAEMELANRDPERRLG